MVDWLYRGEDSRESAEAAQDHVEAALNTSVVALEVALSTWVSSGQRLRRKNTLVAHPPP